jgi:carbon-monoxide dehydrogenase small subunit
LSLWEKITNFLSSGYTEQAAAVPDAPEAEPETSNDSLSRKENGMSYTISMTVNGTACSGDVEARTLLVDFVRDHLELTGTNVGCDTSQCGSCTIIMDGKSVKSCTTLAVQADGSDVTTIEGLATNGDLHPLQQAFWDEHGLQCGFCTPGMIMAGVGILNENPDPSEETIRHNLEGNICRCTGYQNIVKAIQSAAQSTKGAA